MQQLTMMAAAAAAALVVMAMAMILLTKLLRRAIKGCFRWADRWSGVRRMAHHTPHATGESSRVTHLEPGVQRVERHVLHQHRGCAGRLVTAAVAVQREWDKRIAAQGVARVAVEDGDELQSQTMSVGTSTSCSAAASVLKMSGGKASVTPQQNAQKRDQARAVAIAVAASPATPWTAAGIRW